MNELELLHDAERAAAAWVTGDCDATLAITSICASIERSGRSSCAFVRRDPFDIFGSQSPSPAVFLDLLTKTSLDRGRTRALHTKLDPEWSALTSGHGRREDEAMRAYGWLACEPVRRDGGDASHALVVLGRDDTLREAILRPLPRLARICAAIDERDQRRTRLSTSTHRLTNLVAGVIVNVDFASELASDLEVSDLRTALGHAHDSASQLAKQVAIVTKLL